MQRCLLLFVWILGFASISVGDEPKRPNFIFLLTDDQSIYTLGCYGNGDVQTPHIDQLGADGVIFDRHYNTTSICMASRANIMTGLLEYRNGCNFEHGSLMRATWKKSYPMLMREAGYVTAMGGKVGFRVTDTPEEEGNRPQQDFDQFAVGRSYDTAKNEGLIAEYAKEYPHLTLALGAFGADFVKESAKGEAPFCLSISFLAPHMPATPDPRFDEVYQGKTFKKPGNFGRENGAHFSKQSQQGRQFKRFNSWGYRDRYDEVMAIYHQQIYAVDVAVGMIRKAVEEAGVADNTVIIFTSDNGFACGSHGYGSKVLPYEEASRVPMIAYFPGHENSGKGLRSSAITGNIDFYPTMLEMAGVNVPEGIDGKSLAPLYDDPSSSTHEQLPLINVWGPKATHVFSVVTSNWKYIYYPYDKGDFEPAEELYHIGEDPLELKNEFSNPERAEALEQMRKRYDAEVAAWKKDAVPYHNYQPYGAWFERK